MAKRGESLRVLVRKSSQAGGLELPGVDFVYGDVTDAEAVRRGMEGCQRVTHMAAIVGQNVPEAEWWRVNRDGARNVLEAAKHAQVESIVLVSSISVLGYTRPGEIADETRPVEPSKYITLYQKTKRAADDLGREFAAQGMNVKIVYPCFGYGCSRASSHPSLQDQTLLRMAAGKPVAIMGSGKNRLCLSYYNDTAEGILLAHERGRAGEDYILGGENLSFPELWAVIARILKKKPPTRRIPLPFLKFIASASRVITGKSVFPPDLFDMFSHNWCFSSARAQHVLGWKAHTFSEGMAQTWRDYQIQGYRIQ
jgi:nucleoside-diphosphate-sugar epimerase